MPDYIKWNAISMTTTRLLLPKVYTSATLGVMVVHVALDAVIDR